mgnify:CR=1 FL=1
MASRCFNHCSYIGRRSVERLAHLIHRQPTVPRLVTQGRNLEPVARRSFFEGEGFGHFANGESARFWVGCIARRVIDDLDNGVHY